MNTRKAIIFDLYGTLLEFNQRAFLRELLSTFDRTRKHIDRDVLQKLLQMLDQNYASETQMLTEWCRAVGIDSPDPNQLSVCSNILKKHIAEIKPYHGARTVLAFLKRRGWKLGLLSNSAQIFTAPLKTHGLDSFFDSISFSCETGQVKPDSAAYLAVCHSLGVAPDECFFIGDSYKNDYLAPVSLGMKALCLGRPQLADDDIPADLSQVAWASFGHDSKPFKRLILPASSFQFRNTEYSITKIETLADSQHGRYNIIGRIYAKGPSGLEREFYCKRYLAPESAFVEDAAYRIMDILGMAECHSTIIDADEPLLVVSKAEGHLWTASDMNENSAEIVGAHCALAYIIGNADYHPRNTFVEHGNGKVRLSIIDLEHCFFERALDVHDCSNPFLPLSIDSLGGSVQERTRHRVLSPAALHKVRKRFLPVEDKSDNRVEGFKRGWVGTFELAQKRSDQIKSFLMDRIYKTPPLIIGTQSYRRAMASIDVEDMLQRIHEDGTASFERNF